MKHVFFLSILMLFASISVKSQDPADNLELRNELKGKVKTIKIQFYDAEKTKNGFIKKDKNMGDTNNYQNGTLEFDHDGNIVSAIYTKLEGTCGVEYYYEYADGVVRRKMEACSKENGTTVYSYTGNNLVKIENFHGNSVKPYSRREYFYDKSNLLKKESGSYGSPKTYKYNKKGLLIETVKKDGYTRKEVFTYDASDKLMKVEVYNNNKLYSTNNYVYDENGIQIEPKSNILEEKTDEQGNWVSRVKFVYGSKYYYVERIIEYY